MATTSDLVQPTSLSCIIADNGRVVVLEYEVHGKVLRTGSPYDNRFVSIITVADRKIVHWRDYMDSLAAWNALNPRSS